MQREGEMFDTREGEKEKRCNNIISWVKKRGGQALPVSGSAR